MILYAVSIVLCALVLEEEGMSDENPAYTAKNE